MKKTNKRKKAYKLIDRVFRSEKRIRQAVDEARYSTIGSRKGEGGSGHPSGINGNGFNAGHGHGKNCNHFDCNQ